MKRKGADVADAPAVRAREPSIVKWRGADVADAPAVRAREPSGADVADASSTFGVGTQLLNRFSIVMRNNFSTRVQGLRLMA